MLVQYGAFGIGSWASRRAFLSAERIALIDGDRRITYAEFDRRTDQFARALRELGVSQGDRVAVLMVNSAAFLETMFAAAKLGAAFVPINFRLGPPEVSYVLADSGANVFVWSGQLSPLARAALAREGVRVGARVVVGGETSDGEADFEQALASGEPGALGTNVAGSDLCCLMYTSGTTGRPKGAMLTHDNLLWNVINILAWGAGSARGPDSHGRADVPHRGARGAHPSPAVCRRYKHDLAGVRPREACSPRWRGCASPCSSCCGDVVRAAGGSGLRNLRPVCPRPGRDRWRAVPVAGARIFPR